MVAVGDVTGVLALIASVAGLGLQGKEQLAKLSKKENVDHILDHLYRDSKSFYFVCCSFHRLYATEIEPALKAGIIVDSRQAPWCHLPGCLKDMKDLLTNLNELLKSLVSNDVQSLAQLEGVTIGSSQSGPDADVDVITTMIEGLGRGIAAFPKNLTKTAKEFATITLKGYINELDMYDDQLWQCQGILEHATTFWTSTV